MRDINDRLLVQILWMALLVACLWVLAPFVSVLFWAALLAFASWPLMRLLTRALGGQTSLASAILTCGWMLVVAAPLVWFGFNVADYIMAANTLIRDLQVDGLPPPPPWLINWPFGEWLVQAWNTVDAQGTALLVSVRPYMIQVGNWLLVNSARLGTGILEIVLSLIFVFFFYRDGPRLAAFIRSLLYRLIGAERSDHYWDLVAGTVQRVVNGVIGTAAAQGALAFIGFLVVQLPGALIWGILTFVLSLVPMGPPLIWIPATIWLAWEEAYGAAIFLGIWGFFVISGVDNILKPYLISRGGNLPLVVVLLGVFGGILAFGFMGLFLGPTLLAVAFSLITDWAQKEELKVSPPAPTDGRPDMS
ncbi:putative PurR-regulated permease PerM [Azomonas agilis]|uniref:Putative PurR-regulated permease PerM n=1 Tax=Azomonas agilis TaxID=116849 RepID=A0A562I2W3_9GAMM|nr:AI-2E family transporter [Azomonas agilis]TWH65028.1 putative PurR-regulated permease PerM [Azomonas agilis]